MEEGVGVSVWGMWILSGQLEMHGAFSTVNRETGMHIIRFKYGKYTTKA
jgi:hypothetical protein